MTGRVIISGATGSIGNSLSKALHEAGRNIAVVTRDVDRARKSVPYASEFCRWDQEDTEQLSKFCEGADAVVNLSGAPIFERWKGNYEKEVNDSRILGTRHIVDAITKCSEKPRVFINGSAAGFYGYKGNVVASESSSAGKDYWADLVERWEKEALRAQESGIRTVLIRTSLVLKRSEGALGSLEPYFRKGLGGYISPGTQMFPWVHIDDQVGIIIRAMSNPEFSGPVNSVAGCVSSREFSRAIGKAMGKGSRFPIPAFVVRSLFGKASDLVTGSQVIRSERMEELGYRAKYTSIEDAMANLYVSGTK